MTFLKLYIVSVFQAWQMADTTVPHTKRGFFCNDPSLSLPYKDSTIPSRWLYVNVYGVPVLVRTFNFYFSSALNQLKLFQMWILELSLQGKEVRKKFMAVTLMAVRWFLHYFFAFMSLMVVMASMKNLAGTYRPFFFEVCKPDVLYDCKTGTYMSPYFQCTTLNHSDYFLFEAKRSFPSGHVVCSVFSCGVLMWYLHKRIYEFPYLLAFCHLVCFLWITVLSITRITDNWHHPIDVLGAFLVTLPFVFYVVRDQLNDFLLN